MTKPSGLPEWASNPTSGDIVEPSVEKKEAGWAKVLGTPEKPLYQYFNWYQNNVYNWVKFFDENVDQNVTATGTPNFKNITISGTPKLNPTGTDAVIVLDASDSNKGKPVSITNLATAILALSTPIASQIVAAPSKSVPIPGDLLALVDSADSNSLKQLSMANLIAAVGAASGRKTYNYFISQN